MVPSYTFSTAPVFAASKMFSKITSMCTIAEDTTHCSDQFISGGFRRFDHGSCCPVCDILLTKMELSKIVKFWPPERNGLHHLIVQDILGPETELLSPTRSGFKVVHHILVISFLSGPFSLWSMVWFRVYA